MVTQLQLLLFSALAFAMLVRSGIYPPELRSTNLDVDWVYRRALPTMLGAAARTLTRARSATLSAFWRVLDRAVEGLRRIHAPVVEPPLHGDGDRPHTEHEQQPDDAVVDQIFERFHEGPISSGAPVR